MPSFFVLTNPAFLSSAKLSYVRVGAAPSLTRAVRAIDDAAAVSSPSIVVVNYKVGPDVDLTAYQGQLLQALAKRRGVRVVGDQVFAPAESVANWVGDFLDGAGVAFKASGTVSRRVSSSTPPTTTAAATTTTTTTSASTATGGEGTGKSTKQVSDPVSRRRRRSAVTKA